MTIGNSSGVNPYYQQQSNNTNKKDTNFQNLLEGAEAKQNQIKEDRIEYYEKYMVDGKFSKDSFMSMMSDMHVPTLDAQANDKLDKFLNERNIGDKQKGEFKMRLMSAGGLQNVKQLPNGQFDFDNNHTIDTSSYGMHKTLDIVLYNISANMDLLSGNEKKELSLIMDLGKEFKKIL